MIFIRDLRTCLRFALKYSSNETVKGIDKTNMRSCWKLCKSVFIIPFSLLLCLKFFIIKNYKKYHVEVNENIHNDGFWKAEYKMILHADYNYEKNKCVTNLIAIAVK